MPGMKDRIWQLGAGWKQEDASVKDVNQTGTLLPFSLFKKDRVLLCSPG